MPLLRIGTLIEHVVMQWTHRATWRKGDPYDRLVCLNGVPVARVHLHYGGMLHGTWEWFGQWIGTDNRGRAANLQEALCAAREAWQRVAREAPERLLHQPTSLE